MDVVGKIAEHGILGLMMALFVFLYISSLKQRKEERKSFDDAISVERSKVDRMADKLYDIGLKTIEVNTDFKHTLQSVEKDVEVIRRNYAVPQRRSELDR